MMYTSTRLHKHLPSNVLAQYNDNDVIDNDGVLWRHWHVRKNPSEMVLTFLYISSQPPFRF